MGRMFDYSIRRYQSTYDRLLYSVVSLFHSKNDYSYCHRSHSRSRKQGQDIRNQECLTTFSKCTTDMYVIQCNVFSLGLESLEFEKSLSHSDTLITVPPSVTEII